MTLKFEYKEWFVIIISILLLTDLTILLDIPFLRQIFGFLFLTILPGLLILKILKLNKIESTEKFVLSVGLSISFLMFFGLLVNNTLLSIGYETPLATIPLLISFNIAFVILALIGYNINKKPLLSIPNLNLSTSEKAFLIVPILFPALSIVGMYIMNTTDNNIILMFLLFLIPIYVIFVCIFNQKFPNRLYPVVIFLIGLSLVLLMSLRSNHIIGVDVHLEYYFFRTTLNNLHWSAFGYSTLDACLSISLLPTIYQSILNMNTEFLFKILYSLIFSVFPLAIYVLSKRYILDSYAFLVACFSMFQVYFLSVAFNPRTSVAVLFFALAMMTLFNDEIDPLKKKILFIVFMASCVVSHYSTTYIFISIMFVSFVGAEIVSKKYTVKRMVSLTLTILFFALIFFWYSQVTEVAFNAGLGFLEKTLSNLSKFFIMESRSEATPILLGYGIMQKNIAYKIEFIFTWLIFVFIGIGIITMLRRYKEISVPEHNFEKPDYLKKQFDVEYSTIALACVGLLVIMIALPYLAIGYDIMRLYSITATILAVFFVIGGITIAKKLSLIKEGLLGQLFMGKKKIDKRSTLQRNQEGNRSLAYLIILLILIPYFLCVSSVIYNITGVPRSILLNSEGESYDQLYLHDQESSAAKWLKGHTEEEKLRVYGDRLGSLIMVSQATASLGKKAISIIELWKFKGFVYLRYDNVINDRLQIQHEYHNLTECQVIFIGKGKIYNNGGSEIYR